MPIPAPLEFVMVRLRRDESEVERRTLRKLSGVDVPADEARSLWPRILDHKWYMSERMGRDVGLRVAAIDFIEHVEPRSEAPSARGLILGPARAVAHTIFADPVAWLRRVLTDFTDALRGVSGVLGSFL